MNGVLCASSKSSVLDTAVVCSYRGREKPETELLMAAGVKQGTVVVLCNSFINKLPSVAKSQV